MFNALWKMREGFVTGAGLILVGLLLQYTAGPIDWSAFAFPVNAIVLALYLLLLVIIEHLVVEVGVVEVGVSHSDFSSLSVSRWRAGGRCWWRCTRR